MNRKAGGIGYYRKIVRERPRAHIVIVERATEVVGVAV